MKYGSNRDDFDGSPVPRPPHLFRRHFLEETLGPVERTVYLGMLMESIRGSWTAPGRRQGIIEEILGIPPSRNRRYSLTLRPRFVDTLERSARDYGEQVRADRYNDGRFYRGESGYDGIWASTGGDVTYEMLTGLSYFVPDDQTWTMGACERAIDNGAFDR